MSMEDSGGISKELKNEIRKEAFQQVSKWLISGLILIVGFAAIGWWSVLKPWIIAELGANPPGTVIAVDARDKCPAPWNEFNDLAGRVIVGAGQGDGLLLRKVTQNGGHESVTLRVDQLPPHEHPINAVLTEEALGFRRGWTDNSGGWWLGRVWIRPSNQTDNGVQEPDRSLKPTRKAEFQGGPAQPLDIMPPFYVLRYCIR